MIVYKRFAALNAVLSHLKTTNVKNSSRILCAILYEIKLEGFMDCVTGSLVTKMFYHWSIYAPINVKPQGGGEAGYRRGI